MFLQLAIIEIHGIDFLDADICSFHGYEGMKQKFHRQKQSNSFF